MPLADPSHGKAYWQQVSLLVSRSWARQVRGVRRGPSSETVRYGSSCTRTAARN